MRTGGPSSPAYTLTCTSGSWVDSGADGGSVDHTPDNVTFTDVVNQTANASAFSNTVTISGVGANESVMINITDGVSQYNVNGETVWDADVSDYVDSWNAGNAKRLLMNGDTIRIRTVTPSTMRTTRTVNVYIGTITVPWNVTTRDCPNAGDVCADGSVAAGLVNSNYYRTTPADAPSTYKWMTNTNSIDTSLANCTNATSGNASCSYGQGAVNTATLAGLSDAKAPYVAAQYCDTLVAHGQSDWFLPSTYELGKLFQYRAPTTFAVCV